ncbi:MAG: hypothetical protein OK456_08880 [Thaumarchaeota archaeon]|nr:hypothetical protein [Nitrososphaerota archaeon]
MDSQRSWAIIGANLGKLVELMLTVPKGTSVDVFCDPTGKILSFSGPSGPANLKLCAVSPPDLDGSYGVHPQGSGFVNDDGEEIPKDQLPAYLVKYIEGARDGGAEWGWEFKLP